ncbi:Uncharacterized protein TCM_008711 [Theobroma cacao]|uniref:Uncharacterized protein n=1 Tax=Theobroma cacao TaxID=3641 RepID=A0A061EBZ1_THECC|nr:Uncharacterized protein TCM_008711 [Theobroma cacao]
MSRVVSYLIRVKDYTPGSRIGVYLLLVQLRIGSRLSIASRSKFRSCILESKVIDLNLLSYLGRSGKTGTKALRSLEGHSGEKCLSRLRGGCHGLDGSFGS